jgi:hypothetical protein
MEAMSEVRPLAIPDGLKAAMSRGSENFRRYAQDVARELQYQDLREYLSRQANAILLKDSEDKSGKEFAGDLRWLKKGGTRDEMETTANSHTAWRLARILQELDLCYGQGDYDSAVRFLGKIKKLAVFK